MKIYLRLSFICVLLIYSCTKKEFVRHDFKTELAQYEIIYPEKMNKEVDNYIEVNDYKSKFDTVVGQDRYPVLYVFIEDTIVGDNVELISLIESNKINYGEYSVYDGKFKIPKKMLLNKSGNYKLSVAVLDLIFNDTIKANPSIVNDEDKLPIDFLDSRSYHDIIIH